MYYIAIITSSCLLKGSRHGRSGQLNFPFSTMCDVRPEAIWGFIQKNLEAREYKTSPKRWDHWRSGYWISRLFCPRQSGSVLRFVSGEAALKPGPPDLGHAEGAYHRDTFHACNLIRPWDLTTRVQKAHLHVSDSLELLEIPIGDWDWGEVNV